MTLLWKNNDTTFRLGKNDSTGLTYILCCEHDSRSMSSVIASTTETDPEKICKDLSTQLTALSVNVIAALYHYGIPKELQVHNYEEDEKDQKDEKDHQ